MATVIKNKKEPSVVKFAFYNFSENSTTKKWSAKCRFCDVVLTETAGVTSGFTKHLSRRHEKKYQEYLREQHQTDSSQRSIVDFAIEKSSDATVVCSSLIYSASSTRSKQITQSLLHNLIIGCGLPLSLVDNPNFCKFIQDIDPKYSPPCRQTLSYSLIPKAVDIRKEKLQSELQKCSSVALTTDVWTDRRMHSYLGITVHSYVGCVSASHLLAFKTLRGTHTGQKIADDLDSVTREYCLKEKVRFVVTDNASNMLKALCLFFPSDDDSSSQVIEANVDDVTVWDDLSPEEQDAAFSDTGSRIACFVHSLQLVVRGGLEKASATLRPAMGKISKLASVVHQSQLFRSAFEDKFGTAKSIPSTNDTRWNSMYRQLQAIVDLDQSKLVELLQQTSHDNLILTAKELAVVQEIVDILHPFAEATDITQGEHMVTISMVVPTLLILRRVLLEQSSNVRYHSVAIRELLDQLHERFFFVFERLLITLPHSHTTRTLDFDSDIFLMAPALDPRYAFRWLQDHPGAADVKDALRYKVTGLLQTELAVIRSANADTTNPTTVGESSIPAPPKKPRWSLFEHYSVYSPSQAPAADGRQLERQLTHYLDYINASTFNCAESENTMSKMSKRSDFATLLPLFERVLCTPASSAPVERIFSQSGLLVRPHRAKLSDKMLEELMFLKCNAHLSN